MHRHGIQGGHKGRELRTIDGKHSLPLAPNLLDRQFSVHAPNLVWLAGIATIATGEGRLYRAVVLDLLSRRVFGGLTSDTTPQELTIAASQMAITNRRPTPVLMRHSDRRSLRGVYAYCRLLNQTGMLER